MIRELGFGLCSAAGTKKERKWVFCFEVQTQEYLMNKIYPWKKSMLLEKPSKLKVVFGDREMRAVVPPS